MSSKRSVTDFYSIDVPAYAAYDNLRKIGGVDGLKISMRKILYTLLEKYPGKEKIKTDTVANICAAYTCYIHGSQNLCGVCDTMTQSFVGSNNYPLLNGNSGGFGTRINPTCAAPRYTKISLSPIVESLLNKDDIEIVGRQFFEGQYIEPQYFVPIFPIIFLNGSDGISTGFGQGICPRNPNEIIEYIEAKLDGKEYKKDILPWYRGFKGLVRLNSELGKNECWGVVAQNSMTSYTVSEIPIGIGYQKYIEILDTLCDKGIIVDYDDKCDTKTDEILFDVKTTREFTRKYENIDDVARVLKLVKTLPENFCSIDSNNRANEYTSIYQILDDFIEIRLDCYKKRKDYILSRTQKKIDIASSKYEFCNAIINGDLVISSRKKDDIVKDLEGMKNICKVDDNYNYLLNMPIHSISHDTLTSLKKDLKELKDFYKVTKSKDIKDMWKEELTKFMQLL